MTGIERLSALADEMGRGGWQGLGGELRSIAEQIEREQETDGAAHGRRAERTCRIVSRIDKSPSSFGGVVHRCSSCGKALPKALFRNGWTKLDYCPRCGAKVVEG